MTYLEEDFGLVPDFIVRIRLGHLLRYALGLLFQVSEVGEDRIES